MLYMIIQVKVPRDKDKIAISISYEKKCGLILFLTGDNGKSLLHRIKEKRESAVI